MSKCLCVRNCFRHLETKEVRHYPYFQGIHSLIEETRGTFTLNYNNPAARSKMKKFRALLNSTAIRLQVPSAAFPLAPTFYPSDSLMVSRGHMCIYLIHTRDNNFILDSNVASVFLNTISPYIWATPSQSQGYWEDLQLAVFTQILIFYSRPGYHQPSIIYFLVAH